MGEYDSSSYYKISDTDETDEIVYLNDESLSTRVVSGKNTYSILNIKASDTIYFVVNANNGYIFDYFNITFEDKTYKLVIEDDKYKLFENETKFTTVKWITQYTVAENKLSATLEVIIPSDFDIFVEAVFDYKEYTITLNNNVQNAAYIIVNGGEYFAQNPPTITVKYKDEIELS